MVKPTIFAFIATFALISPAAAQKEAPLDEPRPTTFQRQATPLDSLLNDGWFVHSIAGNDGEILMLVKATKFMRCYLSAPKGSLLRFDLNVMLYSTCHALN